ncbi:MAG: hypothetical protein Q4G58_16235 [bacterium]|nr:hypothetical protein [bacterium]
MNELVDQIVYLIGTIPTFVWVIGIAALLVIVGAGLALVITVVKFLRKEKGARMVKFARKTVENGFSHAKDVISNEIEGDTKAMTRRFISQMKANGMSDMQIQEHVAEIIKEI